MKRSFALAAGLFAAASLSAAVKAGDAQNGSAFDNKALAGFELSDAQVPVPPAPAELKLPGTPADELRPVNELKHGPTPAQAREMTLLNEALSESEQPDKLVGVKYRPYADFEKTGYLIMSADLRFNSLQGKREMAKALPPDATLVIFWENPGPVLKERILKDYEGAITPDRIRVISLPGGMSGFWARDGVPVPVFDKRGKLTLIDAKYYYDFEADREVSKLFHAGYEKHRYLFEGGNFQANTKGDCMIVNNESHAKIPDRIFAKYYGCRQVIRLPHVAGIGHVDEVARFINDTTIVTDIPEYKDTLASKGFRVHMLPRPARPYETYVNSLIVDGKVVVPVFKQATDAEALAVYESLGLKATGGDSVSLSNMGQGSLHCITMTYPPVPMADLLKAFGAREI